MSPADHAGGLLRGAADTVRGTVHEARSGSREYRDTGREAAAHARWATGLPARNQWERDHFAKLEVQVTAGRMHLDRVARQASAMEAAMTAEANREAGS